MEQMKIPYMQLVVRRQYVRGQLYIVRSVPQQLFKRLCDATLRGSPICSVAKGSYHELPSKPYVHGGATCETRGMAG